MANPARPTPASRANGLPPAVLIERFVITATSDLVFIGFDGVAPNGPNGTLGPVPAFSGIFSPANAQAFAHALEETLTARLTLSADKANPQ